jgi:hypothetical protein
VREQLPALAGGRVQFERQMIRVEPARAVQHQNTERVTGDERVKLFDARFVKVRRRVHTMVRYAFPAFP